MAKRQFRRVSEESPRQDDVLDEILAYISQCFRL